jgi:hypothetical protein
MAIRASVLLKEYSRIQAHAVNERRDDRMAAIFRTTRERIRALRRERDVAGLRALLLELGKDALAHSGDWVLQHRRHPVEMKG